MYGESKGTINLSLIPIKLEIHFLINYRFVFNDSTVVSEIDAFLQRVQRSSSVSVLKKPFPHFLQQVIIVITELFIDTLSDL